MADPIDLVHLLVTLVLLITGFLLIADGVAATSPPQTPGTRHRRQRFCT